MSTARAVQTRQSRIHRRSHHAAAARGNHVRLPDPGGATFEVPHWPSSSGSAGGRCVRLMQRLVQEGLLRAEPNRGLFVKELDEAGIRDLYVARTAIETAAGRLIITSDDRTAVSRLRTIYAEDADRR